MSADRNWLDEIIEEVDAEYDALPDWKKTDCVNRGEPSTCSIEREATDVKS